MIPIFTPLLTLDPTAQVLTQEPIIPFALLLLVILVIPILFEKLKLPALVGLVCAGVVLGPSGWGLFDHESAMMTLLSDIGLVYLMFIAGLEFNIPLFWQQQSRSLVFGGISLILPLLLGTLAGLFLGFNGYASILIGCLLSSHSLLAYPIIRSWGVVNNQAVSMTMGSTIVTDVGTLLILTVALASFESGVFTYIQIITKLGLVILYFITVLFGFNWLSKEFCRRSGDDEGNKFLCVLMSVFLAVVIAQLMGLERVVGFFLAGLAVNETVGEGPVKEKLVFIGSVLFIPLFFIHLGLQIDLATIFNEYITIKLLLVTFGSLMASKFVAAVLAKLVYHYNWQETVTIWSLSIPLVGTTLAVALGGYKSGLLSPELLNCAIILVLITATVGPWLTNWVAGGAVSVNFAGLENLPSIPVSVQQRQSRSDFTVVVPVYNPQTQKHLIEMAALLACQSQGKIIPLAIAHATAQMDAPQLEAAWQRSENLLAKATAQSQLFGAHAEPLLRIDDAFAPGICRAAREQKANLIIIGWGKRTGLRARLLGNVIDNVLWSAHCPVAVARLVESPKKIQRILVPIENLITPSLTPIHFAQTLADANQCHITVLNVCDRRTCSREIAARRSHLSQLVSQLSTTNPPAIQIISHENTVQAILQAARLYDLVILPSLRNRTSPGGLAVNDATNELARQLTCSIIILGEPQHHQKPMASARLQEQKVMIPK